MSQLRDIIRQAVIDRAPAIVMQDILQPIDGPNTPIAPPTYAPPKKDDGKGSSPRFSRGEAPVPVPDATGWLNDVLKDTDGATIIRDMVMLDTVAAESHRASEAIWNFRDELGFELPAIVVEPDYSILAKSVEDAKKREENNGKKKGAKPLANYDLVLDRLKKTVFSSDLSTWTLAHRHADAWILYSLDPDTQEPVYKLDGKLAEMIGDANQRNGDMLYRWFVYSAIFGAWLSRPGMGYSPKIPRAYSSQIVGYDAHEVTLGSTKSDPANLAKGAVSFALGDDRELTVVESGGNRPSQVGLGQIANTPLVRRFVCGTIARRASINLAVLRQIKFTEVDATEAITTMTLLALLGHVLSSQDAFLRSGCALTPYLPSKIGVRNADGSITDIENVTVDDIVDALRESVAKAKFGDGGEDCVKTVTLSDTLAKAVVKNVVAQLTPKASDGNGE